MRIGIVNNAANYFKFNINLGLYLKKLGFETVFLNNDRYLASLYRKSGFSVIQYPVAESQNKHYTQNSPLIRYYKRVYRIKNIDKLISLKDREFNSAFSYLQKEKFDYLLILNGSFNVESEVCQILEIPVFYFEHGYFPDTIQMNRKGVNCAAEYAELSRSEFMDFEYKKAGREIIKDFQIINPTQRILLRQINRLFDPYYKNLLGNFIRRKINLDRAGRRFKKLSSDKLRIKEQDEYIFWPLQVNSDTQIILNSPFDSMYDALEKYIPKLLQLGFKIILKEHPMEVEPVDYSHFTDNEKVFLVSKYDLNELIDKSIFVVNINSSVGLQAISRYKKVLILGSSLYSHSHLSLSSDEIQNWEAKENFIKSNNSTKETDEYIRHFKEDIFIKGHFYSPDINLLHQISERLVP